MNHVLVVLCHFPKKCQNWRFPKKCQNLLPPLKNCLKIARPKFPAIYCAELYSLTSGINFSKSEQKVEEIRKYKKFAFPENIEKFGFSTFLLSELKSLALFWGNISSRTMSSIRFWKI